MTDYTPTLNPPGPVVSVRILDPVTGRSADLVALIDTGAALSVIPAEIVDELGLSPVDMTSVRTVSGEHWMASTFRCTCVIEGYVVLGVEFVAVKNATGLLGRDVLQHFILTLDGKAGQFTLVDP